MDALSSLPPRTYRDEANVIRKRMKRRMDRGVSVTPKMVHEWVLERHPNWKEADCQKVLYHLRMISAAA